LTNSQTVNKLISVGSSADDGIGVIRLDDYWGKCITGYENGSLNIPNSASHHANFFGVMDNPNGFPDVTVHTGDHIPQYDLNSKLITPPFDFGLNHKIYGFGFSNDTVWFGATMTTSPGINDSVTFLFQIIQGLYGVPTVVGDGFIISDIAVFPPKEIVAVGKSVDTITYDYYNVNGPQQLFPLGLCDAVVLKMDTQDYIQWVKVIGGAGKFEDAANAVTSDKFGNIYVSGHIHSDAQFDSLELVQHDTTEYEGFLCKYDSTGQIKWVTYAGYDAIDVVADSMGNCYVGGFIRDSAWFDTTLIISSNNHGMFLAKYNTNGKLLWVKKTFSNFYSQINQLKLFNDTLCYAVGVFSDSLSASNLLWSSTCIPDSNRSAFTICFDTSGVALWGKSSISCHGISEGYSIDVSNCAVVTAGIIDNTSNVDFDTLTISSIGGNDGYWAEIDTCSLINFFQLIDTHESILVYPNPTKDILHVLVSTENEFLVTDLSGKNCNVSILS
jgi:hypothetical protein